MNKIILIFGIAILFAAGSTIFIGCNNTEQHHTNGEAHEHHEDHDSHNHKATYQCPMQCEGDKTYEKAGKCPSCGMEMEAIKEHKEHEHLH